MKTCLEKKCRALVQEWEEAFKNCVHVAQPLQKPDVYTGLVGLSEL